MRRSRALAAAVPAGADMPRHHDARLDAVVVTLRPGDYYVARAGEFIATVLGSCVSACIRDRRLRRGGMNHFMLPGALREGGDRHGGAREVARFGNVAMEQLIGALLRLGGRREDLELKLVGGGHVLDAMLDVGARNVEFVRQYVRRERLRVVGEDLGEGCARKVIYDPASGHARVKRLRRAAGELVAGEQRYRQELERAVLRAEIDHRG